MWGKVCVLIAGGLLVSAAEAQGQTAPQVADPSGDPSIIPADARLEELWTGGEFTEGVAVGPDGNIYFSDIPRDETPGRVLKFDPRTAQTSVHCSDSGKSNGLMFDRQGRLIACCGANYGRQALCRITPEGEIRVLVDRFEGQRLNSPNDLLIHPRGWIYFTDPRYVGPEPVELDHMSVYRFDPADRSLTRVTRDITKPNGVVVSPDGRTLYVAETNAGTPDAAPSAEGSAHRMTLNAFPVRDDGSLGGKRVLIDYGTGFGIDGMTVDREGHVYAAVRDARRAGITVYSPDGQQAAHIPTPELPTNCCFGRGAEQSTLYITAGGGLYRIGLKIPGYHPATADPS